MQHFLHNISNECYDEYMKIRRIYGLFINKMVELSRLIGNNNDAMYGFDLERNDDEEIDMTDLLTNWGSLKSQF